MRKLKATAQSPPEAAQVLDTLTLVFPTPKSGNQKSRTKLLSGGRVLYYSAKEVTDSQEKAMTVVQQVVEAKKWTVSKSDWYHVTYILGIPTLLSADYDNLLKTINDCLSRTTQRRRQNKKKGIVELHIKQGGNAIWDDKRIVSWSGCKYPHQDQTTIIIYKVTAPMLLLLPNPPHLSSFLLSSFFPSEFSLYEHFPRTRFSPR